MALEALRGVAAEFQIDLVDGKFVPSVSWPFTEADMAEAIAAVEAFGSAYVLEFDLMVEEPLQYFEKLVAAGAKRIIVHYGSTEDYAACVAKAHENDVQIGIAVLPTVALESVVDVLEQFDYVQVMGIREVGKQGQSFAPETTTLITQIHEEFPGKEISVDGSVNIFTIPLLVEAGATRLAPGSAVIASEDMAGAYRELEALANSRLPE